MKKLQALAVGMGLAIILPAPTWAVCDENDLHEGHYSGHSKHTSAPGVFTVGEILTAYTTINTTQVNPWYPWDQVNYDYTLVITAEVSSYSSVCIALCGPPTSNDWNLREVYFTNASFAFYEDAGTAPDYANVATFTDGALILSGTIAGMYAQGIADGTNPDNYGVTGTATITGGTGAADALCDELVMNDFLAWLPNTSPAGYKEAYDPKWECCIVPTSEDQTSWGRMKGLYR